MLHGSRSRLFPALALAMALPGLVSLQAAAPAVDTYVIDSVHSGAKFEIAHLVVSTVSGQFTRFQGNLYLNTADITKSRVEVVIDAASVTTNNDARDKHLRSDSFFDVAKYPTITFKSSSVAQAGPGSLQVGGTLTMHGVARPVVIAVTGWGTAPGAKPGTFIAGFRKGTLQLKRSEFGMTTMVGPVGNDVDITLSVEANKVQPAQ
ncbi:MAG: YceI family protein [Holophaga sp.]|nr:YceI family protein [Holophaga sp.]